MKTSKGIVSYVVLSLMLAACVAGMIVLGFNIFSEKTIKMKNLESCTKDEVLEWANKNDLSDLISYTYEYSEDIEEGNVISQSIMPNETVDKEFSICISKGSIIELNVNDYKTKKEFDDFISKYPKVIVSYEDDTETNDNGELTKFSKNSINIKADSLIVYLSSNTKDKKDDNKDDDKGTKVLIPDNLLGMEEDKFIKKLNDLGFKNLKKDTQKYYSFKSKKDTIYSYDDGKFETSKTINYAISLGDYVTAFKATEYNNKTKSEADATVKKYNDLNAHITLSTKDKEVTDTSAIGELSNCKCEKKDNNSIITCDLGIKEVKTETVESFAGKAENELLTSLKAKGFNNFNKKESKYSQYAANKIAYNDTGSKKTTDTISYYLSLGVYTPNLNEFNGKTLANAKSIAANYTSKGADVTVLDPQQNVEDETKTNNTLTNCESQNVSGKYRITCSLVVNKEKHYLLDEQSLMSQYATSTSFDNTKQGIEALYKSFFPNLQCIKTSVAFPNTVIPLSPGQIYRITVNDNHPYSEGKYESTTSIKVYIVDIQTQ